MPEQVSVPPRFNPEKATDDGRTNAERAAQAFGVLQTYDGVWGVGTDVVSDLLADLLHLCDRQGWDFEEAMTMARKHHAEER